MAEETLPGTTTDERPDRIVLHVDMDCFYASCERLREPALVGEPVVVGMGYEPGEGHGAVATASYEARKFGVESAQPISTALDRLPRLEDIAPDDDPAEAGYYRTVDIEFYKSVAAEVKEILHDCADVVREVSIDEAYLDVTDRTAWDLAPSDDRTLAEGYARYVKQRIAREVGVPASIGVAPNMSTAKIASDFDKPDGLVVVRPGDVRSFLEPLPVEEVHGVGPVTARELGSFGIETAGDLAAADASVLESNFGSRGRELHERARGYDDREVTPTGRPKSLSRESAFTDPTADPSDKREVVRALAADVADRAQSRGAMYRTIGIKVVVPPFDISTRARSLSGPVDDPDLVESVALDLLDAEFRETRVRKLGVRVSNLSFSDADQSSLDGWESSQPTQSDSRGGDPDSKESDEHAPSDGGGKTETERETKQSQTRRGQSSLVEFD
ncbi:DNA polymerase IV [Haloferax mediterranei ATCC 33500]|uniref:DNA polymerase IV n=1 Tax=Haloferax mediterranei (strain ATCC 33500 / DSM 1411 / JCM 8866 / NBRC 14739 / NCIMB 2177 / R-4) TaxID=523841 RepID=I3R4B8_HALMT|nr:DNA polymerase IV [Haloferax mediterranei]AFK19078.1 DNA polymerase IV (archaeal DinB-like DNA polymerase) [Haloferax mediterranei ATCC 33500]AHZ21561.1 DNA polymerase IV [Haloferax mediterranei ATCC 33500]EMA04023.1 DNA polymerase IV [Haloferax mediterranei ATCC 33500]MDX5989171.1 DNA polymerase IV [Haloferax mediterranei ATCC 33500]QCQ75552.1 DNA polymerase IV [Haloferax mediterranei ATCC 33500]